MISSAEVEILLVEDNPRDAEMTLRALRKGNPASNIVHVQDGQEALDWLHGSNVPGGAEPGTAKVVILDLKLPRVDGLEVLRAVRAHERTRMQPVVVMTSSQEQKDVLATYSLGVNSYVVKPMDWDSFAAAVVELGHYWLHVNKEPS